MNHSIPATYWPGFRCKCLPIKIPTIKVYGVVATFERSCCIKASLHTRGLKENLEEIDSALKDLYIFFDFNIVKLNVNGVLFVYSTVNVFCKVVTELYVSFPKLFQLEEDIIYNDEHIKECLRTLENIDKNMVKIITKFIEDNGEVYFSYVYRKFTEMRDLTNKVKYFHNLIDKLALLLLIHYNGEFNKNHFLRFYYFKDYKEGVNSGKYPQKPAVFRNRYMFYIVFAYAYGNFKVVNNKNICKLCRIEINEGEDFSIFHKCNHSFCVRCILDRVTNTRR